MQWIGNCSHLELDVHLQLIPRCTPYALYFNSLLKEKKQTQTASSRKQRFSSADTVLSQVLAAALQTNYTIFPQPAPPGQSPDSGEAEAISTFWQCSPQPKCTQVWDLCACKAWHREQPAVAVPGEFHTSPKESRKAKGEKTKPPQNLSINASPATALHFYQKEFLHKCSCMTIRPSAE